MRQPDMADNVVEGKHQVCVACNRLPRQQLQYGSPHIAQPFLICLPALLCLCACSESWGDGPHPPPSPNRNLSGFARLCARAATQERSTPFAGAPTSSQKRSPACKYRPAAVAASAAAAAAAGSTLANLLASSQADVDPDLGEDEYETDSWLTDDEEEEEGEDEGEADEGSS